MNAAHGPAFAAALALEVGADEAGLRLDVVLVQQLPALSRARAAAMIAAGEVRVDGRRAPKGLRVTGGEWVTLARAPEPASFAAAPDPRAPVRVRFEDDWLVVIEKPAAMPTHPLRPGGLGTAAGALVARYPEMAGVGFGPREPGVLHRLDTDTSGLLLAARDERTFEALREALVRGAIDKRYVALVHGALDLAAGAPRRVEAPIGPVPGDPGRVRVGEGVDGARPATTELVRATPRGPYTEVEVRAFAAARHQVRAHLAWLGHPLVGDVRYGAPATPGISRHLLHASAIAFVHPRTGERVSITSRAPFARDGGGEGSAL